MGDFQGPTVYLPEGNIWAIYMITTLVNLWENLWDLTRNLQGTAEMGASQANAADVLSTLLESCWTIRGVCRWSFHQKGISPPGNGPEWNTNVFGCFWMWKPKSAGRLKVQKCWRLIQKPQKRVMIWLEGLKDQNGSIWINGKVRCSNSTIWLFNSLPWKITISKNGKPSISIRAIYTMANR